MDRIETQGLMERPEVVFIERYLNLRNVVEFLSQRRFWLEYHKKRKQGQKILEQRKQDHPDLPDGREFFTMVRVLKYQPQDFPKETRNEYARLAETWSDRLRMLANLVDAYREGRFTPRGTQGCPIAPENAQCVTISKFLRGGLSLGVDLGQPGMLGIFKMASQGGLSTTNDDEKGIVVKVIKPWPWSRIAALATEKVNATKRTNPKQSKAWEGYCDALDAQSKVHKAFPPLGDEETDIDDVMIPRDLDIQAILNSL